MFFYSILHVLSELRCLFAKYYKIESVYGSCKFHLPLCSERDVIPFLFS